MNKKLKYSLYVILSLIMVGTIGAFGLVNYWDANAPVLTKQSLMADNSSRIYDKNGKVIWESQAFERQYIKYSDLSTDYINGLTSVENRSFFTDSGVNLKSLLGAVFGKLTGSSDRGASTLTQQLVKLSVFSTSSKDRTIKRKVQEIYLAQAVTKAYSKQQILEFYVNKIYMGHQIYGVGTASQYYFGKPLKELSLSQSAILAGLQQAPTVYDLYGNQKSLDLVKARRDNVLQAMVDNHKISQSQAEAAMKVKVTDGLVSTQKHQEDYIASHQELLKDQWFVDSTLAQVQSLGYNVNEGGLSIKTAFDPKAQDAILSSLDNNDYVKEHDPNIQGAGTMVDVKTGAVIAQVGGRNTGDSLYGLNRATAGNRSTGSGIKPLIDYGPAIEDLGWGIDHILYDTPYKYPGTNISIGNATGDFVGPISMIEAVAQSRNIPAIKTLEAVGGQKANAFLSKLNLTSGHGGNTGGSDAIGINASTAQMASAYAAVSNNGTYQSTRYVTEVELPDGSKDVMPNNAKQAMQPGTAYLLLQMMKHVLDNGKTGEKARIDGLTQAVKTGTVGYADNSGVPSTAISDLWVNGVTKGVSFSLWMGYDNPMDRSTKSYIDIGQYDEAHYVYKDAMSAIAHDYDTSDWGMPNDVYNSKEGLAVSNSSSKYPVYTKPKTDWSSSDFLKKSQDYMTNSLKNSDWNFPKEEQDSSSESSGDSNDQKN